MSDFDFPENLRYTAEHEWVAVRDGEAIRVGITAYAQDALGDVVYVSAPAVGSSVTAGEACGEVESTKSVSDLYSPLSGTITAVNEALDSAPELVNTDPYGDGWIFELAVADASALEALMDAAAYRENLA